MPGDAHSQSSGAGGGGDPVALDRVANRALAFVEAGMTLGLGSGRASEAFIRALGARVTAGLAVRGIATSLRSETLARGLGIPLVSFDELATLDLAVDGADEVSPALDLTKGLGGALVRERVVAAAARRFVVLVTPEKLVARLGSRSPIPVETITFARAPVERALAELGARPVTRRRPDGAPFVSDNGQLVIDAHFPPLDEPARTAAAIRAIPGVVDSGLFLGMASLVLVSEATAVRELAR